MTVIPFTPAHLESLLLQPKQAHVRQQFETNPAYGPSLVKAGRAFTALAGDRVLACAGVIEIWEGRAEAWALMGDDLRREFLGIHHAVKRFLSVCGYRRIEAAVDVQFEAARAWVEALGFVCEGPLRKYTPDGRDCLRYARVN